MLLGKDNIFSIHSYVNKLLLFVVLAFCLTETSFVFASTEEDYINKANISKSSESSKAEPAKTEAVKKAEAKVAQKSATGLFGTVELKSKLKDLPKWQTVLDKEKKNPSYTANRLILGKTTWQELRNTFEKLPLKEQLNAVNTYFNKWAYKTDDKLWGVLDYWAVPIEFFPKSGDCEDYAIAKYFALRDLGIPTEKMRIVVLEDTLRKLAHAVLAVYVDNDVLILDNVSNAILSHKRLTHYKPQYSVNEQYRWAHMKPK